MDAADREIELATRPMVAGVPQREVPAAFAQAAAHALEGRSDFGDFIVGEWRGWAKSPASGRGRRKPGSQEVL